MPTRATFSRASVDGTEKNRVPASAIATSVSPAVLPACDWASRRKPGPREVNMVWIRVTTAFVTTRNLPGSVCGCGAGDVTKLKLAQGKPRNPP